LIQSGISFITVFVSNFLKIFLLFFLMQIYQGVLAIESIEMVARKTKRFRFSLVSGASLDGSKSLEQKLPFCAGQFVSLQFLDKAWRAYSIASTPAEERIELVIRIVPGGLGSGILDQAVVGDTFNFKGPFGHFLLSENESANLVFCGTGTGIAPLRSMILTEKNQKNRPMRLWYGGRDAQDIAYLDELKSWAEALEIRLGFSRDERAREYAGYAENCRITQFLEDGDFDEKSEFYICGNGAMVKSLQELLAEKGVEKSRIFMERCN
jgi:ferredoxin-NADP reductase